MPGYITVLTILLLVARPTLAQGFDGCPMYGCRPSGSFSVTVSIPVRNATINWVNEYFLGPIPNAAGCVGNSLSLVCQSNGPGPADTGMKSYDIDTGAVRWRDPILRFPALPLLDVSGTVFGSDGSNLASYTAAGKLRTQSPLHPMMRPLFGLQLVGVDIVLLVSETGEITTMNTDGVRLASMVLTGFVERDNGTFIPTAPPVVNGNRFYVLTEFAPNSDDFSEASLGLQRLYAIDAFPRMTNGMTVAWYANFEREQSQSQTLYFKPRTMGPSDIKSVIVQHFQADTTIKPSMLWDKVSETVFVALPPPAITGSDAGSYFIGVKDTGNGSAMTFRMQKSVVNLALFEVNFKTPSNAVPQLWGSSPEGKLVAFTKEGQIDRQFDVTGVLKTNFTITTKISVTRTHNYNEDLLIFGMHVEQPTEDFKNLAARFGINEREADVTSYVVAMDTPENGISKISEDPGMPVMWMVPCPDGSIPYGQIVGVPARGSRTKDQLVVFSQIEGKFGKVFTITEKAN